MTELLAGDDAEARPAYSSDESVNADTLYSNVAGLQLLALLSTAVVFIVWFRRVRLNAEVFDASQQPMKPGWAIGAWFVPIAQFWLPRRVAGGIWAASARFDEDGNWRTDSTGPLERWWAAWVLSAVCSCLASEVYERAEGVQEIREATALYMACDVINVLAAVLAIVFVRQLTRMQGERVALGAFPHATQAATSPISWSVELIRHPPPCRAGTMAPRTRGGAEHGRMGLLPGRPERRPPGRA